MTRRRNLTVTQAKELTTHLDVLLDGHAVTALVDAGAGYSVMSGPFVAQLKKVKTVWEGPLTRTTGGHFIMPTGICRAAVTVHDPTYPATFVILQQSSRDVILGMDFLSQHGAIIELKSKSITLPADQARPPESSSSRRALSGLEDQVSIPPRSSIVVSVGTRTPADVDGVIEGDQRLLLDSEICVARGVAQLHGGKAKLLLTDFSQEFKHINKGTTVAYIEEVAETGNAFVLWDLAASTSTTIVTEPVFDI